MAELLEDDDGDDDVKKSRYQKNRARLAKKFRENSAAGRDIGPLPEIVNVERRNACLDNFRLFCETYFKVRFPLKWSADHLRLIEKIQTVVVVGGCLAIACPRKWGKTTLVEAAALWSIIYSHRQFVVLIGATADAAEEMMDSIKMELETNELLLEDFPEVCYPIRRLERQVNLANRQTLNGVNTLIKWNADRIQFPNVAGSASSGSIVKVVGITGRLRGMKAALPNGKQIRPDLVIPDDPQTEESAASPVQNLKREKILCNAVLGLAGPKVRIAALMPCTVIFKNDMVDKILTKRPEWQGERMKTLYSLPNDLNLWDQYLGIRKESPQKANDFLKDRWEAMHAGAVVGWDEKFLPGELGALAHGMHVRHDDFAYFQAEYQNDPLGDVIGDEIKEYTPDALCRRINGVPQLKVPRETVHLTCFIDPGVYVHWYSIVGWSDQFGGGVVDYGCWPRQNRANFDDADARPGLRDVYKGYTDAQLVYAGLRDLTEEILSRPYLHELSNQSVPIDKCLIDSGFESDAVHKFIRSSRFSSILLASKGFAVTTTQRGISTWKPRPGERKDPDGGYWRLTRADQRRCVQFDPDHMKTFLHSKLTTPMGSKDAITFFGDRMAAHEMISNHLAAQYGAKESVHSIEFHKWQRRPDGGDWHWLDTLTGNVVACSVLGLRRNPDKGVTPAKKEKQNRGSLQDYFNRVNGGKF